MIDGLGFSSAVHRERDHLPGRAGAEQVVEACKAAMQAARVSPVEVGYLELPASGTALEDEAASVGLACAYDTNGRAPGCAVGSVTANIGHTWAASGMAGLIKAALSLDGRYLPATPGWTGQRAANFWQESPFYVADRTRPWFVSSGTRRRVAVNSLGLDGSAAHLIMSQGPTVHSRVSRLSQLSSIKLLPIAAHDRQEILVQLDRLVAQIEAGAPLAELARSCLETFGSRSDAQYTLALLAGSPAELLREIVAARSGVPEAFERMQPWLTPMGSYFAPRPLGGHGGVAFVYPGAFNSYLGMGRQLFQLFPSLHEHMAELASDVGRAVGDPYLYPRWRDVPFDEEIDAAKQLLRSTPAVMIESGASLAVVLTTILRNYFGLR